MNDTTPETPAARPMFSIIVSGAWVTAWNLPGVQQGGNA